MPVPTFSGLPPFPEFEDLENKINTLVNELRNLLLNLDTLNIAELNANVIIANTVTADKLKVNQLSAISADLGHITAGLIEAVTIYGSKFATSESSFPRVEISETEDLIRIMLSTTNYIEITPNYSLSGQATPTIRFFKDGKDMVLGYGAGTADFMGMRANDYMVISSLQGVFIPVLEVINWGLFTNNQTGRTLQQDLNALTSSINTLATAINGKANSGSSTSSAGGHNHGIVPGTELVTTTGTVTWVAAGGHTHTQN